MNVRVISATHQSLETMVERGTFRQDLYYRLNIVPIKLPPLRERKEDIAPLAHFFLSKMNEKYGFNKVFHPDIISFMEQYAWPGNIRELENLIERLAITADHQEINMSNLPLTLSESENDTRRKTLKELLEHVEREVIVRKLAEHKTTRRIAKVLGISQSALVKKIQKLGIK